MGARKKPTEASHLLFYPMKRKNPVKIKQTLTNVCKDTVLSLIQQQTTYSPIPKPFTHTKNISKRIPTT
jgi:hypothetical protein